MKFSTGMLWVAMGFAVLMSARAASDLPRDHVLAQSPRATVTVGDYQDELGAMPENMRFEFALAPKRVVGLIDGLLFRKTLAAEARKAGLTPDPKAVAVGPAYADRSLANDYVQKIEQEAGAAFDADPDEVRGARARDLSHRRPEVHDQRTGLGVAHPILAGGTW